MLIIKLLNNINHKNMFQIKPYYLICFLALAFSCAKTQKHLTKITAKNIAVDSTLVASTEIDNIVAPHKAKLTSEMERILT